MLTNRRNLGILIILIGLIILGVIIYFLWFAPAPLPGGVTPTSTSTGQLPGPSAGTTTPSDNPSNYRQYNVSQEPVHQFNSADLEKRSMAYAERIGSFSSQSDYGNFTDLRIYMTASFKSWTDKYVEEQKLAAKNKGYYGIETLALTTQVKTYDERAGRAEIVITTERRETTDKPGAAVSAYRQKLDLSFVLANGEWLIDKAYWEQ